MTYLRVLILGCSSLALAVWTWTSVPVSLADDQGPTSSVTIQQGEKTPPPSLERTERPAGTAQPGSRELERGMERPMAVPDGDGPTIKDLEMTLEQDILSSMSF